MRRIMFYLDSGYVGADRKEIFEFDDEITNEEIEEAYKYWVMQFCGWYELENE